MSTVSNGESMSTPKVVYSSKKAPSTSSRENPHVV